MISSKKFLIALALISAQLTVFAQCATDHYIEESGLSQEQMIQAYEEMRMQNLDTELEYRGANKKAVRVVSVVFHVIHTYGPENISREQIEDQMRILNEDFQRLNTDTINTRAVFKSRAANMELEFKLARKDPNGNCTDGIVRYYDPLTDKGDDPLKDKYLPWDQKRYLNIWVVRNITYASGLGGTILGYAFHPVQFGSRPSRYDGVVIRADRVGSIEYAASGVRGRTLVHEIGHWLGLYHPFQFGCSNNGDLLADTPPVDEPSYGCPTGNNSCSNDSPDLPDMVENYMDYANDACMNMFTNDQKNLANSYFSLPTSDVKSRRLIVDAATYNITGVNTNPNCAPVADFYTDDLKTILCQGSGSISFKDFSYNGDITDRQWLFEGGNPSVSTFENPTVQYSDPGIYKVTLIVGNASGYDTMIREQFITVLPTVAERKAPFGEDFESANYDIGWQYAQSLDYGWTRAETRGYGSSKSAECRIDENTPNGTRYALTMPPVDILGHGAPLNLTFRHAYARRASNQTEVLLILVSEDCGETWNTVKGMTASNGLASTSAVIPNWVPSSDGDWGYQVISLNNYASSRNLMLRFDVISKEGNSIFLDDINIGQFGLSVDAVHGDASFEMYPNPAGNEFTLNIKADLGIGEVFIRDISGRLLLQQQTVQGENRIDTRSLSTGVYLVELKTGEFTWSKKLIIK